MRARQLAARFLIIARPAVALGLLAALWFGTVTGVDRATREVDERRQGDRLAIARGFATSASTWIDAGRREATGLAERVAAAGSRSQSVIDDYVGGRDPWGRSVLVVDNGGAVVAGSRDRLGLVGRVLPPCVRIEEGAAVSDNGLTELSSAGRVRPVVSRLFQMAPDCASVVAAAARAGAHVVVVIAGFDRLADRLAAANGLGEGTRFYLVDPAGQTITATGVEAAPAHVAELAAKTTTPAVVRRAIGRDDEVVEAAHPAGEGWVGVLETDAATFAIDLRSRPALAVAGVLTVVFAAAFGLVAFFDVRRQRAQRRADVAKQAFLSIVNHELRTPLTVLKGSTDVMTAHWERLDKAALESLVESLTPQVLRLSRVVDRLLVAANIQAGVHVRPVLTPTAVRPVVERAISQLAPAAPLHTFSVDVKPGAAGVLADGKTLDQVLVQLLDNAVKYSPAGGEVTVVAEPKRRSVEIAVCDRGVGLPADRHRIFEAFTQGEAVDRRVHAEGGVGVGLYIVRTLVTEMGGEVWAEPHEAGGARLVIRLRSANVETSLPSVAQAVK